MKALDEVMGEYARLGIELRGLSTAALVAIERAAKAPMNPVVRKVYASIGWAMSPFNVLTSRRDIVSTSRFFQKLTRRKGLLAFADDGAGNAYVTVSGKPAVYLADHESRELSSTGLNCEQWFASEWKSRRSAWKRAKGIALGVQFSWGGKTETAVARTLRASVDARFLTPWTKEKRLSSGVRVAQRTMTIDGTSIVFERSFHRDWEGPNKTGFHFFFTVNERDADVGRGLASKLLRMRWTEPEPDYQDYGGVRPN
jgi:hypothetical protein